MIILTNIKNYYNSQIAYLEIFQNKNRKKNENTNKFIFGFLYQHIQKAQISPYFVYYLCLKWLYIYVLYFSNPIIQQKGFCKLTYELLIFIIIL